MPLNNRSAVSLRYAPTVDWSRAGIFVKTLMAVCVTSGSVMIE
jgi:hypothetical protein